jgi:type IV pilus assembly protein PilC
MAEFHCRVASLSGEIMERTYSAEDEAALRRELEADDLLPLEIREQSSLMKSLGFQPKVSPRDFLFFNQELVALIKAGLPILHSFDILIERRKDPRFRQALEDVRQRVKSGESMSEAFMAQGTLFPPLYAASLASGERSGELATVIERFVRYTRTVMEVRRKVVAAMIYPTILFSLSLGLIGLLIFYVIPRFSEFLTAFDTDLPMITQIVMDVGDVASTYWLQILILAVGSTVFLLFWRATDAGKVGLDRFKLALPLVGPIARDYAQNRFTRTLSTLQAGGIPLVTSLELSSRAVANQVYENALLDVTSKVREGASLWESLDETGLISDIAIEMVKVGESTGQLSEMLGSASDFTDEEIDYRLTRTVALVEPIILIFMAVVVAIMLLSMYLPMFKAMQGGNF